MIDSHIALSIEDIEKLRWIKSTPSYSEYMKSIIKSSILNEMLIEHVNDIDITPDIEKLKEMKASSKNYNEIFKTVIKKIAGRITTDTIILKEIMDSKVEDVKNSLDDDFRIRYLMGLANDKYYKDVEGNPDIDPDSVLGKGLLNYLKRKMKSEKDGSLKNAFPKTKENKHYKRKKTQINTANKRTAIDITGSKISLD